MATASIAMRCLFIHSARHFQERSGADHSHLPELYRLKLLDEVDAEHMCG
jgi:hypothetical protein